MKKYIVLALSMIVAGSLVACGPSFKTEYTYETPTSPTAQACAAQCSNVENYCKIERMKIYEKCKRNYSMISDQMFYCKDTTKTCDENLRQCLTMCGTKVISKTVQVN